MAKRNLGKVKLETVGSAVAPHASMLHAGWVWDISEAATTSDKTVETILIDLQF